MKNFINYLREIMGLKEKIESPKVVIIGGGTAGITVSAQLKRSGIDNITIIDPADYHYFQPGFTLVTAGMMRKESARRKMEWVVPRRVNLVRDSVVSFDPEKNEVLTEKSGNIKYDYLVVSAGLEQDWSEIKGLPEGLGVNGVCSSYSWENLGYAMESFDNFKGGNALFARLSTSLLHSKPQKIMFLLDDIWKKREIDHTTFSFLPMKTVETSPYYEETLRSICVEKGIPTRFDQKLLEIKAQEKIAIFRDMQSNVEHTVPFDFFHIVPPLVPRRFIKDSVLSNEEGYVYVDKETLIHIKYPNILSLGDCSSLPTAKTVSATSVQAPVLVNNLVNLIEGKKEMQRYEGYASSSILTECGLILGRVLLCEFGYGLTPYQSFFQVQKKQSVFGFHLKAHLIPYIYWYGLMTGRYRCKEYSRYKGFL